MSMMQQLPGKLPGTKDLSYDGMNVTDHKSSHTKQGSTHRLHLFAHSNMLKNARRHIWQAMRSYEVL